MGPNVPPSEIVRSSKCSPHASKGRSPHTIGQQQCCKEHRIIILNLSLNKFILHDVNKESQCVSHHLIGGLYTFLSEDTLKKQWSTLTQTQLQTPNLINLTRSFRLQQIVDSRPGRIKSKTMKLISVASSLINQ